ncbi:hypothetical protein [Limobrevibacterium gyesilva]|uniref:Uncharacterized protein n=1 Tax=Limobrevibacterium gyesilva TaxID=2991712 RepID=A0AA41YJU9_9PROT|nr:hypothetical protein [Limobrevibacterium gyesilva]MCW3473636.1 hypothetical protein [Limobrevibacterium gyesilva]
MARVVMLLAFAPGLPEGDLSDRLELSVPLTPQGHLDESTADLPPWSVCRTEPDGRRQAAELLREGESWVLRRTDVQDAPLWNFESQVLRPGEYVTLRRPTGDELVFRIVDVQDD